MRGFESFLPSDEWQAAGVHWHAFTDQRGTTDRTARRAKPPEAVLRSPWEVARWIDARTREHVHKREVWALHERLWVSIGDEDDLEHLRQENYIIASRGDSIHTDIYAESERHDVYVEAVTNAQCRYGCTAG